MNRKKIIRYSILLGIFIGLLLLFNWFYSYSTLTITSPGSVSGNLSYEVTNQSSGKTTTYGTSDKSFTVRVPKGDYEVLARANGQSYYEIVTTAPFLRTTVISAEYKQEGKREFIADSPESCAHYQGGIALTYSCNGPVSDVLAHMPATSEGSTFTQSGLEDIGNFENRGVVSFKGKTYLLVYGHGDLETTDENSTLYEISETATLVRTVPLRGNEAEKAYRMTLYKDGVLFYSDDYKDLLYYTDLDSDPSRINTEDLGKDGFSPAGVEAGKDSVALIYSDTKAAEEEDTESGSTLKGKTLVQIYGSSAVKTLEFKEGYTFISLCGDSTLCFQNGENLSVYDIGDKKQKLLFRVTGVRKATRNGDSILVEKGKSIITLNPASRKGFASYSAGDYDICGTYSNFAGGYGVCISGADNRMSLLSVSTTAPDTDSIDKKISGISEQPYIDTVSIYKSVIYISPNVGELVYNPATKGYEPDASIKARNQQQINKLIDELGINRSAYSITVNQ